MTTALAPDEILLEIRVPPQGGGWGFAEVVRRAGDFALAGVVALLEGKPGSSGRCESARLVGFGVGDRPVRLAAAEEILTSSSAAVAQAAAAAAEACDPPDDVHASAEYRRHLAAVLSEPAGGARWVGTALPLKEDVRLVAGRGRFIDDLSQPGQLHAAFLRSPHAHARIVSIDTRAAAALPGVAAVLTGAEASRLSGPIRPLIPTTAAVSDYCLAVDRARYVGEPVAAVAAVDRATAEDALELIRVEYDPLPAVVDPEEALKPGATLLYPELGTNVVWHDTLTYGDVDGAMARAHGVLRERFTIQRYASTPLETFGVIAAYDRGVDSFEFWTNDQRPNHA